MEYCEKCTSFSFEFVLDKSEHSVLISVFLFWPETCKINFTWAICKMPTLMTCAVNAM